MERDRWGQALERAAEWVAVAAWEGDRDEDAWAGSASGLAAAAFALAAARGCPISAGHRVTS
ncbi:MAG: hypothetical protein JW808_03475 [Victivallales bacterium]|nr:hypothetical protein [Victivallales bacterium]